MNGAPAGATPCAASQANSAGNVESAAAGKPAIVTATRIPAYGCAARVSILGWSPSEGCVIPVSVAMRLTHRTSGHPLGRLPRAGLTAAALAGGGGARRLGAHMVADAAHDVAEV